MTEPIEEIVRLIQEQRVYVIRKPYTLQAAIKALETMCEILDDITYGLYHSGLLEEWKKGKEIKSVVEELLRKLRGVR